MEIWEGQQIFINSRWNSVGWRKGGRKFLGEKMKHFPAMFSRQVQNVNRFPWIFPNMTFLFENYMLSLKKNPYVQRKGSKGRSEMPSEGNKTSNWAEMDCYELSQKDICSSLISFFAEKPEKNPTKLLWSFQSIWTYFSHHFPALVFLGSASLWLSLRRSTSFPPRLGPCRLGERSQERCPKSLTASSWMADVSLGSCPPMLLRPASSHTYLNKRGKLLLLGPATPCSKCRSKKQPLVVF